jgi:hemoglobin
VGRRAAVRAHQGPIVEGTLYHRLGGIERIAAVVDEAVDRHAVNPLLAPRFQGKDLPRLKRLGTQFFCAASGGPKEFEGRDPRAAQAGMSVSEQEFLSAVDDIVAALDGQRIASADANEVVAILRSLKRDVLPV